MSNITKDGCLGGGTKTCIAHALQTIEDHCMLMDRIKVAFASCAVVIALSTASPDVAANPTTLSYQGGIDGIGVLSGKPKVYLVVWGGQWGAQGTDANGNSTFTGDSVGLIPRLQQLYKGLGTANEQWSSTLIQYCDGPSVVSGATSCPANANYIPYPLGGVFAGVWYDNSIYPGQQYCNDGECVIENSEQDVAQEAVKAAAHFGNTTPESNRQAQYIIASPTGTNPVDFRGAWAPLMAGCGSHNHSNGTLSGSNGPLASASPGPVPSPYGDIIFTNMPYFTDSPVCMNRAQTLSPDSPVDFVTVIASHEYAETITDAYAGRGWISRALGQQGEIGDLCAFDTTTDGKPAYVRFSTGTFLMAGIWSNADNKCIVRQTKPSDYLRTTIPAIGNLLLN